jgi:uncharacterized damage-inducible protein DinB
MSSPQLTPDQAKFILGMALSTLRKEHETTKRVIEAIPLDKGEYRPDAISKTALELAWHIAATEQRFFNSISAGAFDFSPLPRPETITNSAGIAAWFDQSFAANLQKLEGLSGEALIKVLDFRGMFQLPAVGFIQLAMSHSIHHRGSFPCIYDPWGPRCRRSTARATMPRKPGS